MPKSKKQRSQENKIQTKALTVNPPCHEVDFVLECNGAEHVYVCGDFNDWQPTSLRMIGSPDAGLWKKRLVLPPGRHEYTFVVDGQWQHDRDARDNVLNEFGTLNSVVEVQP
ncbi:MAG TPA: glycoside hydrolase [Verrucomicrobia subdivision 3 bacterium]|nr:glycoside hydrolase [Limisphaerales bacterium]